MRAVQRSRPLHSALEITFGHSELTGLLEGPAQELAPFLAFLVCTGLLQNGLRGFLDGVGHERDVRQGDDDLPDLAVNEVGLASVYPAAAGEHPGPALHADGVLDVLVFEAEHLDPEPVCRYDFGLYAYGCRHGHSLTAANRQAIREPIRPLTSPAPLRYPR